MLLLPPSDARSLYMGRERGHQMESSVYVLEQLGVLADLGVQRSASSASVNVAEARARFPMLWRTRPRIAVLEPGDILYIPHRWFHEVLSRGPSVAVTHWVSDRGQVMDAVGERWGG